MIKLQASGNDLPLGPISQVLGSVHLVGSKSLTNRALLLSALSTGRTKLTNILPQAGRHGRTRPQRRYDRHHHGRRG